MVRLSVAKEQTKQDHFREVILLECVLILLLYLEEVSILEHFSNCIRPIVLIKLQDQRDSVSIDNFRDNLSSLAKFDNFFLSLCAEMLNYRFQVGIDLIEAFSERVL